MTNTREKLIELIRCADFHPCKGALATIGSKFATSFIEDIADHLIANGVTVQEWIPVTERLPEDDLPSDTHRSQIRCLVATDKGTVKRCVRQRYEKKIDGKWQLSGWEWNKDTFAKPTHWMPLPEPPKGE